MTTLMMGDSHRRSFRASVEQGFMSDLNHQKFNKLGPKLVISL